MYRLDSTALDQLDRAVDRLHELWDARYGWPYLADPLAAERMPGLPSPNRDRGRGRRGRSAAPVIAEINEDNDPWYWLGD